MKLKKGLFLIAVTTLATLASSALTNSLKEVAASDSAYLTKTLNIGDFCEIESNGEPFYISFNKMQDSGETARFAYVIDELDISDDDLKFNAGFFISDSANINNGYIDASSSESNKNYNSFDEIANLYSDGPADAGDVRYYCFKKDTLCSILPVKELSNVNVIVRDGVSEYGQKTLGSYTDRSISDGCCYGYYFDGAKVKISFLVNFLYPQTNQVVTIHYQNSVNINVNSTQVTPTINSESYTILNNKDSWSLGDKPIYNSSLCYIPFTKITEKGYIVEFDHIEVNQETKNNTLIKDGSHYYLVIKLSSTDTLDVIASKIVANEDDNVQIHDLYDVSNQVKIVYDGKDYYGKSNNGAVGIGNIPNSVNNAFRFKITLSAHHYTKFGIWTSNSGIWSNFGYIIRFGPSKSVFILSGEEEELAKGECSSVVPNATITAVVGIAKLTDANGRWFANRIFVDIDNERVCEYNDYERRTLGSAIIAPYFDIENTKVIFEDYRLNDLVSVSTQENNNVHTNNPTYTLKGEQFIANFSLDEGYKFKTFLCNGVDAINDLEFDNGLYTYKVDNVTTALNFTYTLLSNQSVHLTVSGSVIDPVYTQNPLYGSKPTVSFSLPIGKHPSSVMVNGTEKVEKLSRNGSVYSLDLDCLISDTVVNVSSEDKSYNATAILDENTHASVTFDLTSIPVGGTSRINISIETNYVITDVIISGEAILHTFDGAYYLKNVYSDVSVKVLTKKVETFAVTPLDEFNWPVCTAIIVGSASGVIAIGFVVAGLILRKKGAK